MIYLDNNATTPICPEALEAATAALRDCFGNPSSAHAAGRKAKKLLAESREKTASLLGARASEIVFTGSGSEADHLAILGTWKTAQKWNSKKKRIVVSGIEHPAVTKTVKELEEGGADVAWVAPGTDGRVSAEAVGEALTLDTLLVTVILAQNETGVLNPVKEIAARAHACGAYVHTDAVQAAGKIPVNVNDLGVDMLSLAAHKFHGPKGVGALYVRTGTRLGAILQGGGQEQGLRPGTENVAGIAALAAALEAALRTLEKDIPLIRARRDRVAEAALKAFPSARWNGTREHLLPNTASLSFPGLRADMLMLGLDTDGICVSTGSACHSGAMEPSAILKAMGLDDDAARSSLRLSLSRFTTDADAAKAAEAFANVLKRVAKPA
ncbi:MAG: cysteine desulfurase [Planctomycetia bacterium]|nr:cysteine desulfurase [Planctomycetia bacterium]